MSLKVRERWPADTCCRDGFFERSVHDVARDLIGCTLLHDGVGGVIVETESYHADDPACHAYGGPTQRNRVLFGPAGRTYVYLSYGMHNLLNVVAEPDGQAAAVLIRALEPTHGIKTMRSRRGARVLEDLCSGPGKLTQALGIDLRHNDRALEESGIEVEPRVGDWTDPVIVSGPRVGIRLAIDHPWRFCAVESRCVSKPRPITKTAA